MALTPEQLRILQRPFELDDHEFLEARGQKLAYLKEDAVTARLEQADPSFTFEIIRLRREADQTICEARLTVCGVWRDGVGMQGAGEADKGAATDALKRAARLFGVGRYLLNAPKNEREFKTWLANLTSGVSRGGDNGKLVSGIFNIRHMKVLAQRGQDGKQYYQCVMERNMGDPIVFTGSEPFVKSGLFTNEQMSEWKLKGEAEFNPELRVKWDGKTVEILGVLGEAVAS